MENKSHAMAAGVFIIVMAALLVGLSLWLTRDQTDYTLYELSSKDSVSGLQTQAPVRYKGVAVGKVTRIGFDPQTSGHVLIRIAVDADAPISPTTFATLGYQGVTGLAHILLDDGETSLETPPSGPSGLPRLPLKSSPLSQLAEQGPAIMGEVQEAMQRLNRLLGDENQQRFGETLNQLSLASASVNTLVQRLDGTIADRLDPALAAVPGVAQDARLTLWALREAGDQAAAAAEQIGLTVRDLNAPGGPLGDIAAGARSLAGAADRFSRVTLPSLDQAADETARAARRLGRTVSNIGDNPQSLIFGPGRAAAGPGEPGFVPPPSAPSAP